MSLNSAGFDAVILLNERFLNQLSGALFYNGFLRVARKVDLIDALDPDAAAGIEPALRPFLKMHVRLHLLREPSIDFLHSDDAAVPFKMRLMLEMRANITLWDGLELPFSIRLSLVTACGIQQVPDHTSLIEPDSILADLLVGQAPEYLEPGSYMLLLNLAQCELEALSFSWQGRRLQTLDIELDKAVMTIIRAYFAESGQCFALALPSFGAYLPGLPKTPENRLFGEISHCRVLSGYGKQDGDSLAIALNLLGRTGGNPDQLHNFARNCSVGLALPETALQALIDKAWGQYVKVMPISGQMTFETAEVNEFINKVGQVFNIVQRIAVELATLGFVETETTFHGLKFILDYTAAFPWKPEIDFQAGNTVCLRNARTTGELRLRVLLDVECRVEVDPTGWLPDFIPDIEVSHERRLIEIFQMCLRMDDVGLKEAKGTVIFDDLSNSLAVKLTSIDLALDLAISLFPGCPFLSFPGWIQNVLIELAEKIIIDNCPTIKISPPVQFKLPLVSWPVNVRGRKLGIDDFELTATADVWFDELKQDMPHVPKYIVNINNGEIHRLGCSGLLDTYEEHQKGFHL
ncbi:MAG TPA: hypothetical protein DD640_04590, partial [Clostridiales bacterium]|nr:hypothetical protein [Clostridiales bacterium]